ncbi:DNA-directed RNA polymerase subunit beta [Fervidibacillus halotolerans]|uniref:DNA-directed RNA polymerase subunit beta n=1 Tax=Fervidibacillus halotolerans TaxID=2980027 RepID=A0A9E8S003_9BACI|nr:DNA-directed RNA polymerase subunit beta [Fervidibacillus halotolerans]WAA12152.1 DNA-directed RNA polymerase subunit beta [Fervidibacillus halotolerans]
MSNSDRNEKEKSRREVNGRRDRMFQRERAQMDGSMKHTIEGKRHANEKSEDMESSTKIEARTRIGRKQLKTAGEKGKRVEKDVREESEQKKPKKMRIRLIPIWLRIIIVLVLLIVFFFIGAMIGYGIIGDGKPLDVFKTSTWTHIFDIVNKGT